jgi:flagellar capping protein FliD
MFVLIRKPTAEVKGPESSLFTVTANTNGVTLKLSKRLDQLNYVIFVTVSVTIDNVVIRDFVEVRISVSPEDVIRQNIVIVFC